VTFAGEQAQERKVRWKQPQQFFFELLRGNVSRNVSNAFTKLKLIVLTLTPRSPNIVA
jgi:hypothetical protein